MLAGRRLPYLGVVVAVLYLYARSVLLGIVLASIESAFSNAPKVPPVALSLLESSPKVHSLSDVDIVSLLSRGLHGTQVDTQTRLCEENVECIYETYRQHGYSVCRKQLEAARAGGMVLVAAMDTALVRP